MWAYIYIQIHIQNGVLFGGDPKVGHLVCAEPEMTTFSLTPGRDLMLVLACDGIWDVIT